MSPDAVLSVRDLEVHFRPRGRRGDRVRAVDGVSFELRRGETLGLVGESGCGKTSLVRALLALGPATAGEVGYRATAGGPEVDLLRRSPRELRALRRELQVVFQDPYASLNPRLPVRQLVGEALAAHGLAREDELDARVVALLAEVGLGADALHRLPHEFSGGERQRIAIARALALRPRVLVCDEPMSALDVSVRAQIANLLSELKTVQGLTYLLVAHDLALVGALCDRVAVMYAGRIVEIGTREEVFGRPAHPYTEALLAAAPVPDPRYRAGRRERHVPLPGEVPSPTDPPPGCRFHPRCPVAEPRCSASRPPSWTLSPTHAAACHLLEEEPTPSRPGTPTREPSP